MQHNLQSDILKRVAFLVGSTDIAMGLRKVPAKIPFDNTVIDFLDDVSRFLMKVPDVKSFPDVVAFAFWIRRSSVLRQKERLLKKDASLRLGLGTAFHIAPSNVPLNCAYTLAAGLMTGNANIVRVPSKEFPQISIIAGAFCHALEKHEEMKPYILLVRYERNREINDLFSSLADLRVIWGGDATIAELRRSPLPPRAREIAFSDRFSIALIDSEFYLAQGNKTHIAEAFYNDTFLSDQNACTSPRMIVWTGKRIADAKEIFWSLFHNLVLERYTFQPIQGVNKLVSRCLLAVAQPGCRIEPQIDNLIVRVSVPVLTESLMDYRDNSGFFLEYDCEDIKELLPLCDDKRLQTLAYIGEGRSLLALFETGLQGIDRIVPIGKTMDFDLIWDGYDLPALMSRAITFA